MISSIVLSPVIGMRIGAVIFAILSFWLFDPSPVSRKKQKLDEFLSVITTFILLFWAMKLVTTFPLVLEYPRSVLSYPSGSTELYFAVGIMLILSIRNYFKNKGATVFTYAWWILFAGAQFYYLFFEAVFGGHLDLVHMAIAVCFFVGLALFKRTYIIVLSMFLVVSVVSFFGSPLEVIGQRVHAGFYLSLFIVSVLIEIHRRRSAG
ncbi:hypothetical protein [Thalassobacillus hwangdonensis]|uniref:hypothetical protein n=1 Tax=Thalassobacillus hwangdonensis TaxID=546108 RepID=UPI0036DC2C42